MFALPGMAQSSQFMKHKNWCQPKGKKPHHWQKNQCTQEEAFYLSYNFGPVEEEVTATDLEVVGELPKELNGRYMRNGPNPFGCVDVNTHHWFMGDGMVHGVRLAEGRAIWYRNRYVRNYKIAEAFGEDMCCRQLAAYSANTHVIQQAGRTWAIAETGMPPVELSYELETVGVNDFFGTLPEMAYTGHPKIDPDTGHLHAIAYKWPDFSDHVKYIDLGRDGRVKKTVDIPLPGMVMIHDMSLTSRYVVIYDLPVTINQQMVDLGMIFPFAWNENYQPRVGLLPRDGTVDDIIWVEVSPCYVFHPMNAYDDENGNVVLDVCRHEYMFSSNGIAHDIQGTLDRWVINPTNGSVIEERIDDTPHEFPRCHPALNSKPYRYGYSLALVPSGDTITFPAILKYDMLSGVTTRFDLGPGRNGAEPYFIPREGATAEDDGYLVVFVHDTARDASELLVLDASDLSTTPLARVLLPVRVPYGFHGNWVPDDSCGPAV
jgi:carotenoid cleavage dioxygenase